MSDENSTPNENAVITDSAPVTEGNEEAVNTESAPVETSADENTEQQGSEPSKAVKELIAQRKRRQEAEKDAAYWKGVAESRNIQQQPSLSVAKPNDTLVEPNSDDFENWADFEKARTRYTVDLAKHELRQEQLQSQQRQQFQSKVSTFEQKLEKFAETDPSILDIREDKTLPVSRAMGDIIQESDMAPELLKYLDANRKEAQRIYGLSPLAAAKEMGRLEATLSSTPKPLPPKRVSQAPSPIPTVTPSGSVKEFNPETATMEEYYARRMEQLRPNRR